MTSRRWLRLAPFLLGPVLETKQAVAIFEGWGVFVAKLRTALGSLVLCLVAVGTSAEISKSVVYSFQFGPLDEHHLPVEKLVGGGLSFEPNNFNISSRGLLVIYDSQNGKALVLDTVSYTAKVLKARSFDRAAKAFSQALPDDTEDAVYFVAGDASKVEGVDLATGKHSVTRPKGGARLRSQASHRWRVKGGRLTAGDESVELKKVANPERGEKPKRLGLKFRGKDKQGPFKAYLDRGDGECEASFAGQDARYVEEGDVMFGATARVAFVKVLDSKLAFSDDRDRSNTFAFIDIDGCQIEIFSADPWLPGVPAPRFAVTPDGRLLQLVYRTDKAVLLEWKRP